jgi:hypothetical protein
LWNFSYVIDLPQEYPEEIHFLQSKLKIKKWLKKYFRKKNSFELYVKHNKIEHLKGNNISQKDPIAPFGEI